MDFSNQFTITPIVTGQEYGITADFTDPNTGLMVNFDATTFPDPVIDFGMGFSSGDPDVFFSITTPYVGAVNFDQFSDLFTGLGSGYVGGTLPSPGNGSFPDATYAYEFLVNGIPVDFEDPNSGGNPSGAGNFPSSGNLTLEGGLDLSGPDISFTTEGTAGLTPEPGTLALMGFGGLAMAGATWRRRIR